MQYRGNQFALSSLFLLMATVAFVMAILREWGVANLAVALFFGVPVALFAQAMGAKKTARLYREQIEAVERKRRASGAKEKQ